MAIVNEGTRVSIRPSNKIPTGWVSPAVDTFFDYQKISKRTTFEIPKATVENVDPLVTLLNIIQDAAVGLEKQVEDEIAFEYDTANNSNDISFWVDMLTLDTDQDPLRPDDSDFLSNAAVHYLVEAVYYVKSVAP